VVTAAHRPARYGVMVEDLTDVFILFMG
jgi:hypothetical protein